MQTEGVTRDGAAAPSSLVGIAHGTNAPAGQAAVATLMRAVAAAAPHLNVTLGFVDVQQPDTPATLATLPPAAPAIIVPLLLSAGYHVHVDLTEAVLAATDRAVQLGAALGPDDRIVRLLQRRLAEAGLLAEDTLVLGAAGSSDARAVADCRVVADRLSRALGRPVAIGFLSAAEPRLTAAIATARAEHPRHRVVLASYLLAPGYFQGLAEAAGADLVTAPLLRADAPAPQELVDVVLDRYRAAAHPHPARRMLRLPRRKSHPLRGARRRVTADDRA
ncbi:cobalamin biosynthesis protein CbiX [Cryobacterium melibiosiphilum]|uniref:Cobalamin biosynthesis protein CbiX n=1 Tax=Cryobacterium melibiosiphilum TaxID=995039 RepID=A0A3A5MH21_9MICO|nr:CbiX/SirB N-terminal domain-containing protein [Cryobacterium melibiosiphilum]RJT84691.1 cobalamin biosynthesis protein CbiX [Cryobacterium melibiosiphilum]